MQLRKPREGLCKGWDGRWYRGHRLGCTGIVGHHEATAPEDIERCHNYNNTLTVNCDLHLTKMLLLSKIIMVLISIFEV